MISLTKCQQTAVLRALLLVGGPLGLHKRVRALSATSHVLAAGICSGKVGSLLTLPPKPQHNHPPTAPLTALMLRRTCACIAHAPAHRERSTPRMRIRASTRMMTIVIVSPFPLHFSVVLAGCANHVQPCSRWVPDCALRSGDVLSSSFEAFMSWIKCPWPGQEGAAAIAWLIFLIHRKVRKTKNQPHSRREHSSKPPELICPITILTGTLKCRKRPNR